MQVHLRHYTAALGSPVGCVAASPASTSVVSIPDFCPRQTFGESDHVVSVYELFESGDANATQAGMPEFELLDDLVKRSLACDRRRRFLAVICQSGNC